MSPGPTFDRVYLALKEKLRSGGYPPGAHLEPATIGDELCASITPVRDALHRLAGERLVESPRHNGFRTPFLSEATLRHMLRWSSEVALLALASTHPARSLAEALEPEPHSAPDLLAGVARLSRNPEHWWAMLAINDRLAPLQPHAGEIVGGLEDELAGLRDALRNEERSALRRCVILYHRRREREVTRFVEALQPPSTA